jgi:hypothetical protein
MTDHWHHIIPKHMGGSNDASNLIKLSVEEHAEAHRKLYEEHGHWQDFVAWKSLSGQMTMDEASKYAIRQGQLNSANKHRGKKRPPEIVEKMKGPRGKYKKRKKMPPRPLEVKEKIRQSLLGKKHPPERVEANKRGQLKRYGKV